MYETHEQRAKLIEKNVLTELKSKGIEPTNENMIIALEGVLDVWSKETAPESIPWVMSARMLKFNLELTLVTHGSFEETP